MSIVTNVIPKMYRYLKTVGKSALVADKPVKKIGEVHSLFYIKPSQQNIEILDKQIKSAYREYSISPYINEYLRQGNPISPKANELWLNLKEGINRSEKIKGIFVRGLTPRKNHPINPETIGEYIFNNKGFTSTAPLDKAHYANAFAGYKGALVSFEISKPMKAYKADNGYEVIFDANAFTPDKFKILYNEKIDEYRVIQK